MPGWLCDGTNSQKTGNQTDAYLTSTDDDAREMSRLRLRSDQTCCFLTDQTAGV